MYRKHNDPRKVSYETPKGPDSDTIQFWMNDDLYATEVEGQPILKLSWRNQDFSGDSYEWCYSKLREHLTQKGFTDVRYA